MIKINLLPQEAPGKSAAATRSGGGGGGAMVAIIMLFAFAVVAIAGGWAYQQKNQAEQETAILEQRQKNLNTEKSTLQAQHAELQESLDVLRNQVAVLQILDPEDRLFWAKKLNILPMFVPDGVFLTAIGMQETTKEVETPESRKAYNDWKKKNDPNIPRPPRVMMPVISSNLRLNGVAYVPDGTSDQRLELILDFYDSLQQQSVTVPYDGEEVSFLEHMVPVINSTEYSSSDVQGREVTVFSFFINSIPVTANPNKLNENNQANAS